MIDPHVIRSLARSESGRIKGSQTRTPSRCRQVFRALHGSTLTLPTPSGEHIPERHRLC